MASAELSRRVEKVVGYRPLCDMGVDQRREFQEALLEDDDDELSAPSLGDTLGTRPLRIQRPEQDSNLRPTP